MSEADMAKPDEMNQAIQLAKTYLLQAFQGETIENLGLEEARPKNDQVWAITLGFNRRWESAANNTFLQIAASVARSQRTLKVLTVNLETGKLVSITNYKDD